MNKQPATSNEQPATSNEQRATSNQQRTTSNEQPATSNEQPATSNEQPATSNEQPATSNEQPATSNEQPATSNEQPATSNEQPATSNEQPITFSVITVVYNGEADLPGTMESVRRQTYPHIEYIFVDGASKDNSLKVIQEFAETMPNVHWMSEPDKGLYDAMNKGMRVATGDFVWCLNCGDHIHAPDVLEKMAALVTPQTDVLYGETMLVDASRRPVGTMSELSTRKLPAQLRWRDFLGGMLVVHQSFIPRRSIAPPLIENNLCADYDWCIKILKKSRENLYTGFITTDYLMGGISKQRHRQSLRDRFIVMRSHFGLPLTLLAHGWIVFRAIVHRVRRIGKARY